MRGSKADAMAPTPRLTQPTNPPGPEPAGTNTHYPKNTMAPTRRLTQLGEGGVFEPGSLLALKLPQDH
ncbi:unnamed protein product [Eruca vesicaria subsp. sativa]|uniref:Uncharacterized protein n=1 Tax=Eruca vesicaria subsp. sativa TaxID=29727 RepID=A0ABC8LVU2_ERUVS|nr:unnamed protein product [Eruca vesicaria subsp. sativa]